MSNSTERKIALCDDHSIVRHGLRSILQTNNRYKVVAESHDYDSALSALERHAPEVFVVDINLPGRSGIEAIRQITSRMSDVKVMVLSAHEDRDKIEQAFLAGAKAYLCKDADSNEILSAMEELAGEKLVLQKKLEYLRGDLENKLKAPTRLSSETHPLSKLSKREQEVFFMLAAGEANRYIAKKMFLSPRTIETHRARILKKLGLNSSADIIRYAIKKNLISL